MKIKRFGAIAAAMVLAVSSLAACSGGKAVKSDIPGIDNTISQTSGDPVQTAAATEAVATTPSGDGELVTEDGKTFLYINGEKQKDGVVGNDQSGFYYADSEGVIDLGLCDGVEVNGVKWNVIEGKASRAETESDETLHLALQAVAKWTNTSMSRDEKLRACFEGLKNDYLEGVRHDPPYTEIDWPVLYANDIFVYGKGDCFSYGAAFAYIGKAIGCTECYACNSGGHGWAELEGKYYDPEWDMHHQEYNHFGVLPDDPCDVDYSNTLTEGVDWMHVLV